MRKRNHPVKIEKELKRTYASLTIKSLSSPFNPTKMYNLLFFFIFTSSLYCFMESLHNEDSVREVKVEIENVEEEMERKLGKSSSEIPPIDVKDFEEH